MLQLQSASTFEGNTYLFSEFSNRVQSSRAREATDDLFYWTDQVQRTSSRTHAKSLRSNDQLSYQRIGTSVSQLQIKQCAHNTRQSHEQAHLLTFSTIGSRPDQTDTRHPWLPCQHQHQHRKAQCHRYHLNSRAETPSRVQSWTSSNT